MKKLIISIATGKTAGEVYQITKDSLVDYAERVGADYRCIEGDANVSYGQLEKFRIHPFLQGYDRYLFLDSDILISKLAPSIFEEYDDDDIYIHDDTQFLTNGWSWKKEVQEITGCVPKNMRMLNTGVVLFSQKHVDIWKPRRISHLRHWCLEQHLVDCRILSQFIYGRLPRRWNWQLWIHRFGGKTETQKPYFIHAAGTENVNHNQGYDSRKVWLVKRKKEEDDNLPFLSIPEDRNRPKINKRQPLFNRCKHGELFKLCSGKCMKCIEENPTLKDRTFEYARNNWFNGLKDDTVLITTGGGNKYEPGIYRLAESIKRYAPGRLLQIYHQPHEKVNSRLFSRFNCDIIQLPEDLNSGFQSKAKALELTPYRKVWYFDSDVYLFQPLPDVSQELCRFYPNVCWTMQTINWQKFGVCNSKDETIENDGGVWYVDKKQYEKECLGYIFLTSLANKEYDYFKDTWGDQGIWRVIHRMFQRSNYFHEKPYQRYDSVIHPSGFVHRYQNKLGVGCSTNPELPDDEETMRVYRDYKRQSSIR